MAVKVSHITHIDNLASILRSGCLWSDAKRLELGLLNQNIGYSHIKQRRLARPVTVAAGGTIPSSGLPSKVLELRRNKSLTRLMCCFKVWRTNQRLL